MFSFQLFNLVIHKEFQGIEICRLGFSKKVSRKWCLFAFYRGEPLELVFLGLPLVRYRKDS